MKLLLLLLAASLIFTQIKSKKVENDVPVLPDEARLYSHLVSNYDSWNPDRAIMPTLNSTAMLVNFGPALISFNFDEATETGSLYTWDRHMWKDQLFQWDPAEYGGIDHLQVPITQLWQPDIILYGIPEPSVSLDAKTLAVVSYDGSVLYIPRHKHTIPCYTNSTHVSCRLKFGSWTVSAYRLDMEFYEGEEALDTWNYVSSVRYSLEANYAEKNLYYYTCCTEGRTDLTYYLEFKKLSKKFWQGKK